MARRQKTYIEDRNRQSVYRKAMFAVEFLSGERIIVRTYDSERARLIGEAERNERVHLVERL